LNDCGSGQSTVGGPGHARPCGRSKCTGDGKGALVTRQLLEMNAAQGRAEAVRKYFTRTPNQPIYLPAILLALNALGFFLITLWIVIASLGQSQQTPSPQPAPQQTVQLQPPPSSEPQPKRRGKS